MSQEFAGIRDKRIPTEFALIERREDLKKFVINRYHNPLGLVVNVSNI